MNSAKILQGTARLSRRSSNLSRPLLLAGIAMYLLGLFGVAFELRDGRLFPLEPHEAYLQEKGFTPLSFSGQANPLLSEPAETNSPVLPAEWQFASASDLPKALASNLDPQMDELDYRRTSEESVQTLPVMIPERVIIPSIGVDAPIMPVQYYEVEIEGQTYEQWSTPHDSWVGWHNTSATLGRPGNTVLNGHHNALGEVFRYLEDLKAGDLIMVSSGENKYWYRVAEKLLLKERREPAAVKLQHARWILPTRDERLTLITCWPYESNTHRVIVIALPVYPPIRAHSRRQ